MAAEVLAGATVETVAWDHADAARLRADQQREMDLRYAAPDVPGADAVDPHDEVDPSAVFATLLLRVDGRPAGHAALRDLSGHDDDQGGVHPDGTAEVKRVYVAPAFRGRGLSRTLMEAVEETARAAGVRHLILVSGLMQPESLGLYLRTGYEPVTPFGAFRDEPAARHLGKHLVPVGASRQVRPAEGPRPVPGLEVRDVAWDDPDAMALRRDLWAFLRQRYPELIRDVAARGGYEAVDAAQGRIARATFLALLDGRPVGCATLAAARVGPAHLTADPLAGFGGLVPQRADLSGDHPGSFEIRNVFVDPSARRAGVATALVQHVEGAARRRDGRALYLGTGIRQPEALQLYVRLGYRPVLPFPPDGDAEEALVLFLGKAL